MKQSKQFNRPKNLIGPRVKLARTKQKLTRKDLLRKLNDLNVQTSVSSLSRLERQQRRVIDKEVFILSKALNVSMDWLLVREE